MSKSDDDDMKKYHERMKRERDDAREKAMWSSAADEQRQLHDDDEAWLADLKKTLNEIDKKTGSSLDVNGMLDRVYADAKKRGKKLTPDQKARARRAAQQQKKQKSGSGCAVVLGAGGALVFGAWEIVSRLV